MGVHRSTVFRAAGYGLAAGLAMALCIGIPTVLIPNPFFSRMEPTRPTDYVVLTIVTLLAAATAVTYAFPTTCSLQEGKLTAGGVLSFLAVGCPVCNKIVVAVLGAAGATAYFEPIQPILAAIGIAVLLVGLWLRLRAVRGETVGTLASGATAVSTAVRT